jgi:hypothetical protein
MTTIAWDGEALAADTLLTSDGTRVGYTAKIRRSRRCLIGFCGRLANFEHFYSWFRGGMVGAFLSEGGNVFIIPPTGPTIIWGNGAPWTETAAQWALGDGEHIALGAMQVGATAVEAVRAAIALNVHTGGDITVLRREA